MSSNTHKMSSHDKENDNEIKSEKLGVISQSGYNNLLSSGIRIKINPAPEVEPIESRRCINYAGLGYKPILCENVTTKSTTVNWKSLPGRNQQTASGPTRPAGTRKRHRNDDTQTDREPLDGPAIEPARPTPEEEQDLKVIRAKQAMKKKGRRQEKISMEETTEVHIKDTLDYHGRSFLHAPRNVDVNLRSDSPPIKCFLPKSQVHTWKGHTNGVTQIKWFPNTAHLLLSCGMDCRVRLWEAYKVRRCISTYYAHQKAVRDISFDNCGRHFLSAGFDCYVKLWDTETGACISRFTNNNIPYCVKFHPDLDKQHLFVAGTGDKKVICWDTRSGKITQEYNRIMGEINTITFVDKNRRFITTADDLTIRLWEWGTPKNIYSVSREDLFSVPAVALSPDKQWLACQSLNKKILVFSALNQKKKIAKIFTGHNVEEVACGLDFSRDMEFLVSGDSNGTCYAWSWRTSKTIKIWKAHEGVCRSTLWHPHEPSRVVTAGSDGLIKDWN